MKIRESVLFFAAEMDKKLRENDHKGDWLDLDLGYLQQRLLEEVNELFQSIKQGDNKNSIKEAADVGNFSMMIADIIHRKEYPDRNVLDKDLNEKPPSWYEIGAGLNLNKKIRTATAEPLTTPVKLNEDKAAEYRARFGMHRGHHKWDLAISFLSMDNDAFFKLYGFSYVPEGHLLDIAKLHLANRQAIQAAKLSESIIDDMAGPSLPSDMFNNLVDSMTEKEKKYITDFRADFRNNDK